MSHPERITFDDIAKEIEQALTQVVKIQKAYFDSCVSVGFTPEHAVYLSAHFINSIFGALRVSNNNTQT